MLQNGSTNHNVARLWWGTAPSIATETAQKAEGGLGSSRWASSHGESTPVVLAASQENMALPAKEFQKIDHRINDLNSNLEMDHGFSFTIPSSFNTPIAQANYESWQGVPPQHQSIIHDKLPEMDFSSEVAMMDEDGDVVMIDLNDPSTIMMVDQVARDERQAEATSEYADVSCPYPCAPKYWSTITNERSRNLGSDPQSPATALAIHLVCLSSTPALSFPIFS